METRLAPRIETLGREAVIENQLERFRGMLGSVLESNPFYRSKLADAGIKHPKDIRTLGDYQALPLTTKNELAKDQADHPPYGTNLTFSLDEYTRIHQSSGTKGEPLWCLDTAESWSWWGSCWATTFRAAGVGDKDRIFIAFSFGPFIAFWSAHEGARVIGALSIPGGGMSAHQRLNNILVHGATVLVCTPTYALHLAEVAEENGIDIAGSSVRIAIHAGEPGASLPFTRSRIERAWGADCYDCAGATEVGAWGFEDSAREGLYVNEGEFMCEVLDPDTGDSACEGELVITNLGRVGMPVIRYRTGDRVRVDERPSRSGRSFVRFAGGVIGRIDDALHIRGVAVYPSAIENIVRRFSEVGEFAVDVFRRSELDELEIRLEVGGSDAEAVAGAVAREIRSLLGLRIQVSPVPHGSLPRFDLRAPRITDHRRVGR
jgi:phenylacetate-CoA ligase